jgi:hypothetical protein
MLEKGYMVSNNLDYVDTRGVPARCRKKKEQIITMTT